MAIKRLTSRDDVKQYIYMKLGAPVINIEVTDDQMELAVEDSLLDFWKYNAEEGSYMHHFAFTVSAGVSEYCLSGMNIQDAYDIEYSGWLGGINTLFSPANMLLYNSWVVQGNYPGGPGGGPPTPYPTAFKENSGLVMAEYNNAMSYLKTLEKQIGPSYTVHWRPQAEVLEVIPTPKVTATTMLKLYVREAENNVFNNPLFRKLVVARAGVAWGDNLSKYTGTMPDGLTVRGPEILQRYMEEEQKCIDNIRSESQCMDIFIG